MPTTTKSRFPQIARELKPKVDLAVRKAAGEIARGAKQRVPVRTGQLREAIHVERTGVAEYRVLGGDHDAWYGHLVEFGTVHSDAKPFLVPAAEAAREPLEHAVREALGDL